jgi:hypothetical protein
MGDGDDALDEKLKVFGDDEHRVVVFGTPDGLDSMLETQVLALLRRAAELRARYEAEGYAVTHSGVASAPWRP